MPKTYTRYDQTSSTLAEPRPGLDLKDSERFLLNTSQALLDYIETLLDEFDLETPLQEESGRVAKSNVIEAVTVEEADFFDDGFDQRVFNRVMALINSPTPTSPTEAEQLMELA